MKLVRFSCLPVKAHGFVLEYPGQSAPEGKGTGKNGTQARKIFGKTAGAQKKIRGERSMNRKTHVLGGKYLKTACGCKSAKMLLLIFYLLYLLFHHI